MAIGNERAEQQEEMDAESAEPRRLVLYCRMPGLLSCAARQGRSEDISSNPLLVCEGSQRMQMVRDADPLALARSIRPGIPLSLARRLCPTALIIPIESIHAKRLTISFLDRVADLSPIVEPDDPEKACDAAYADVTGHAPEDVTNRLTLWAMETFAIPPVIGFGSSRNAAKACAECALSPSRLADADVMHLWPEDKTVPARLKRLGVLTYGAVANLNESLLVHHFGKIGRQLHRRARGIDLTPLRALYPPPRADVWKDLAESPVQDAAQLDHLLVRLSTRASLDLVRLRRFGRRIVLHVVTESGEFKQERVCPYPVQEKEDLLRTSRYFLSQMHVDAPITGIRLVVDDTEVPISHSLSLFPTKEEGRADVLKSLRRTLHDRFGTNALRRLTEIPLPAREVRRGLILDSLQVHQ